VRGFRDRDFLRTPEGFFFCVVGSTHPPDRVMAYLKYVPSEAGGPWARGGLRYRRAMREYTMASLRETLAFLRDYPFYISFFEAFGTEMSAVPIDRIEEHYRPEERLQEMTSSGDLDTLEERAVELVNLITSLSGCRSADMGITGSLLIRIHVPGISDIDLVVYGLEASLRIKEALLPALEDPSTGLSKLRGDLAASWCARKARTHGLSPEDARVILERKWNMGIYRGTRFSIHPVRTEREAERYGERLFKPLATNVLIRATVEDASQSIFLPAIYRVSKAQVLEGPRAQQIRELCSYDSLYADVAREGEEVLAKGKLEMVVDKREGATYLRLLIGSLAGDGEFIKPIRRR